MTPKITIITVSLNSIKTIENTIHSVLSQDYDNLEYIIQDGNSTDGTIDLIKKYSRIKLYVESDSGIYDAMNRAKNKATGDFLLFLGADDLLSSNDVLSRVAKSMSNTDSVHYGNVLRLRSCQKYDGKFNKLKWGYKNICHQAIFYPRCIYLNCDYSLEYKLVSDWVYNLDLISKNVKFIYIDEIIAQYNDIDGISSTKVDNLFLERRKQLTINAVGYIPYYFGLVTKLFSRLYDFCMHRNS